MCPYDSQTFVSMSGVSAASAVVVLSTRKHMKLTNPLFLMLRVSIFKSNNLFNLMNRGVALEIQHLNE